MPVKTKHGESKDMEMTPKNVEQPASPVSACSVG